MRAQPAEGLVEVDEGHRLPFSHWAGLTWVLALRTFRLRYLRSRLGVGWAFVQPIAQALVLSLIFTKVFKVQRAPHYPLYVLSGIMTWQAFAGSVTLATTAVLDNAALIRKVAMPAIVFPVSSIIAVTMVLGFQLLVLVGFSIISGTAGLKLLLLPVVPPLVAIVALALGQLTSALQVGLRDIKFIVDSLLLVLFYASPVLYSPARLSPGVVHVLQLNPMYGVLTLARGVLLDQPVDATPLLFALGEVVALLLVGAWVFRRRSRDFADLA